MACFKLKEQIALKLMTLFSWETAPSAKPFLQWKSLKEKELFFLAIYGAVCDHWRPGYPQSQNLSRSHEASICVPSLNFFFIEFKKHLSQLNPKENNKRVSFDFGCLQNPFQTLRSAMKICKLTYNQDYHNMQSWYVPCSNHITSMKLIKVCGYW